MPRGTFFILRKTLESLSNYKKMSIGEIAMILYKSKSEAIGQVSNLGLGGIAFNDSLSRKPDMKSVELDLLMAAKGIYVHNIPFKTLLTDPICEGKRKTRPLRKNAMQFKNLDAEHRQQLNEVISHRIGSL